MPIRGLSENRRLVRLGKLHLGIKVKNKEGVEYPKATDYFVCPPEVQAVYGEQPDRLDIIIPVEDDEMWCSQYYRQYSRTRGLICKGNGETCRRMIDRQTGAIANRDSKEIVWKEDMPCAGRECPDYQAKKCQEVMNLQFLLPRVPGLGIWQIDTGSVNSIRNINDNAAMLRAVCERVSWIPLTLTLEPKEVVNPDDGKKKVVRCLNLRHNKGLLEILEASAKPRAALLIPAPLEDQQPLDEITDDKVVEDEVVVQPERKESEEEPPVDNAALEQELFGDVEKKAGAAAPAEAEARQPTGTAAPAESRKKQQPQEKTPEDITEDDVPDHNALFKLCNKFWRNTAGRPMQPIDVAREMGYGNAMDFYGSKISPWSAFLGIKRARQEN